MSSFEMTIRKGDKINLENQAFQTEWGGVYLCVTCYFRATIRLTDRL